MSRHRRQFFWIGRHTNLAFVCALLSSATLAAPVQVSKLQSSGEASAAQCVRCRDNDYLITNGILEVVIGASHRNDQSFYKFPTADALGSVIFIRPLATGINGDIMLGTPYIRIDNTTRHVTYDRLEVLQTDELVTLVATGQFTDKEGARVQFVNRTSIAEDAGHVTVSLTATNAGQAPLNDLIYSLFFDPHQIYDFSPADTSAYRKLRFRGYPRENHLIAWEDRTPRQEDRDYNHSGWDGGMILPDPVAVNLAPGASDTRQYKLFAGKDHRSVLNDVFQANGTVPEPVLLTFDTDSTDYLEVIVREAGSGAVFFRSFQDNATPLTIELPTGDYIAQANFFPGSAQCELSVSPGRTNACRLQDPPLGQLSVTIADAAGASVPGKVSFNGVAPTPSPYFRPVNPSRDEGYWESYKNSVFPVNSKLTVTLPVGTYLVSATRGPEFSIDQHTVHIKEGQDERLDLKIDRVINRPDLVSIDTHLHTLESDGAVTVADKVRALVASGVNFAVATDHNFPVDYNAALQELGLQEFLTVATGAEVTVPERLDYNTYPMAVHTGAHNNGAIDALSTDISSRFALSRARDPGVVVQVNHPRSWQFDYFNWFGLDPDSAAFAYEGFDPGFDVLEVVNGAVYDTPDNQATRRDWFNLLRRGYFFPLVGTSDSHEMDKDEPGFSRTYVYDGEADSEPMSVDQVMQRLRQGRSFASNGPILYLTINGDARPGDTVTLSDGAVPIVVDVWSARWIDAGILQIYVNGIPRNVATQSISHPTARHLRGETTLHLDSDAYIVAEVTADSDLFPMLQRRGADGDGSVRAYALTNPVFIDVDGNGKFDPPLPHKIEIRKRQTDGTISQ